MCRLSSSFRNHASMCAVCTITSAEAGRLIGRGAQVLDGLEALPAPRALRARGEAWAPFRTLASLVLWRMADGEGVVEPAKVKRSAD